MVGSPESQGSRSICPADDANYLFRVLLVEDSPILRKKVREALRTVPGITLVAETPTVRGALDALRSDRIEIIILDLRLTDGSGFRVLEAVGAMTPRPTVLVLTNFDDPAYRRRALESGATFFFDKSVEFNDFIDTLTALAHPPGPSGVEREDRTRS